MSSHSGSKSSDDALPPPPARPSKKKDEAAEPAKKASPLRKYVAWALMLVLGAAAVTEFYAQWNYNKNLKICQEALERTEGKTADQATPVKFDDVKSRFTSQPTYSTGTHSFAKSGIYTWNWQGLRHYKLELFVDPQTGVVWDVKSEP